MKKENTESFDLCTLGENEPKVEPKAKPTLDEIYKLYDEATVEANKKLPKPCYGNSSGYYCNYECKNNNGCYGVTMQKWGKCDCKFKPSCHLMRQSLQVQFKEKNPDHVCLFKQYFDENTYPDIIVPDGIIRMDPIED